MNETFDGTFSLLQMLWGNVIARPLRSSLSVVAISIQVILVLLIVGLTSGVLSEWGKRQEGIGADLLVDLPTPLFSLHSPAPSCRNPWALKIAALLALMKLLPRYPHRAKKLCHRLWY